MTDSAMVERREVTLEVVRDVVVNHLKLAVERDQVQPDTPLFGTGLGLDSVDAVDVIVGLETRAGVRIPDTAEGRASLRTVNKLITLLISLQDANAHA